MMPRHFVPDGTGERVEVVCEQLASLNPAHPGYSFGLDELAFMHRIVWASQ